jgi:predicted transcriptional regulator of viral defense system
MTKIELLDTLLHENNGYLRTSEVIAVGVSKTYFLEYVRTYELERVAQGLYMSQDAWDDGLFVLQTRYPNAIFSHETALYLLGLGEREPSPYSITLKTGTSSATLSKEGVKVYKIKSGLFDLGLDSANTPAGHIVRIYNRERTVCDLIRSRNGIEIQEIQTAIKSYVQSKGRNIPLLMRYAKELSIEKTLRQYTDVLL